MNLAVSCLMGDLANALVGIVSVYVQSIPLCTTVSILTHYFLTTRFIWMNCLGFEYIRRLYIRFIDGSYTLIQNQNKKMCYKITNFFLHICQLDGVYQLSSLQLHCYFTVSNSVRYGIHNGEQANLCWINNSNTEIMIFILPIIVGILVNFILFASVVILTCILSQNILRELQRRRRIAHIRLVLGIFSVLGFTWVLGIISVIARKHWSYYLYIVAQSLHAVLIAFTFLSMKKILLKYKTLLKDIWIHIAVCKIVRSS